MPKLFFNSNARYADLPLHYGKVPPWLAQRMTLLGGAIVESIVLEYGKSAVLSRLSNPFWFQAFGCALGMDWHSSGITTSVMGSLKAAVNPKFKELGIYICGGKGKHSMLTPQELLFVGEKTGLDGMNLANCSRLTAKVDNTAIQDGFQLYQHNFIVDNKGQWSVIQQGMNPNSKTARRYHWHSQDLKSFVEEPHTFIYGENQGTILNLTAQTAAKSRDGILELAKESPAKIIKEMQYLSMPAHHDVRMEDVNMKRLGAMLWATHENKPEDFEELLLLKGMGPRALQSLALVSEIIYGTPTRFEDPARFSFAHGGKDGHPFPVPVKIYDETIDTLQRAINRAKIGNNDKIDAIRKLSEISRKAEESFTPNDNFDALIQRERDESHKYGGRTIFGDAKPPKKRPPNPGNQLELF